MTTTIAWAQNPDGSQGETWNPIRARGEVLVEHPSHPGLVGAVPRRGWHCERVSGGCLNCYAERQNVTMARGGTGLPYNRKSRDLVDIYLDEETLLKPLHWRKPRRVFPCSMTDLFGEWVGDDWLDRIFATMALAPQHTFQVLTKRSARMREYLTDEDKVYRLRSLVCDADGTSDWPFPNIWLGVSAEDQAAADARIPDLMATPAAVRWVSVEPMLGPMDLHLDKWRILPTAEGLGHYEQSPGPTGEMIGWIVCGGESGPGARPFDLAWARSLRDQCAAADVAFFMKQGGENAHDSTPGTTFSLSAYRKRRSRHAEDPAEWPEDLRVREWPTSSTSPDARRLSR